MTRRMAVAGLALVGLLIAIYLTLFKIGVIGQLTCSIGSCETVQLSRWATVFGIPVAAWGVAFYAAMLALALAWTSERWEASPAVEKALLAWSGMGVLVSAWLTYLEAFVIHAWCMYCVGSAVIVTLIFALVVMEWRSPAPVEVD